MRTLTGITTLLLSLSGLALPASASATAADPPAGTANLGSADFTKAGTAISVPDVAPCSVDGVASASSGAVKKSGITFGGGTSSCTTTVVDPETETTTTSSTATGKDFELSALISAGGPRIRVRNYSVKCDATQTGTHASWTISGVSGIGTIPSPVPVGYTKPITKGSTGPVLANAIFNLQTIPGDGSISITMLRIEFAPASGMTGSLTLGTAACSPTA